MGFMSGLMGGFSDIYEGISTAINEKHKRGALADAEYKSRSDKLKDEERAAQVDYTPAYVADHSPAYERSQSPVARAYLESLLTGQNADAVQPWASSGEKVRTQDSFDRTYGGYDDLLSKGEAYRKTQPWKTTTPGSVDQRAVGENGGPTDPNTYAGHTRREKWKDSQDRRKGGGR